jgi:hypothetical protein
VTVYSDPQRQDSCRSLARFDQRGEKATIR